MESILGLHKKCKNSGSNLNSALHACTVTPGDKTGRGVNKDERKLEIRKEKGVGGRRRKNVGEG